MPKIGPFFYVQKRLLYRAGPLSAGRAQADKLDLSYGHDRLWDACFGAGDYLDVPRGRVVWDCANARAIVYIDRCIDTPAVLARVAAAFELTGYVVAHDDHYRCRACVGDLFED